MAEIDAEELTKALDLVGEYVPYAGSMSDSEWQAHANALSLAMEAARAYLSLRTKADSGREVETEEQAAIVVLDVVRLIRNKSTDAAIAETAKALRAAAREAQLRAIEAIRDAYRDHARNGGNGLDAINEIQGRIEHGEDV